MVAREAPAGAVVATASPRPTPITTRIKFQAEREVAEQLAQDEALQAYLDQMSGLLLEKDLRNSDEGSEVRTLARARTLTALGRLDPSRKTEVIEFLSEASLVQGVHPWGDLEEGPIVELSGADLSGADLSDADLGGVQLGGADLSEANLNDACLSGADLTEADLSGTDLRGAFFDYFAYGADVGSFVYGQDRSGIAMKKFADLTNADLRDANLRGTDISEERLFEATSYLDGVIMPDGSTHRVPAQSDPD